MIITDLEEVNPIWLEHFSKKDKHPIQHFVDTAEVPVIVFGPNKIPYMSETIRDAVLPFDREKFIKTAYGINAKKKALEAAIIEKKLSDTFYSIISK